MSNGRSGVVGRVVPLVIAVAAVAVGLKLATEVLLGLVPDWARNVAADGLAKIVGVALPFIPACAGLLLLWAGWRFFQR